MEESGPRNKARIEITNFHVAAESNLFCELKTKHYQAEIQRYCKNYRLPGINETLDAVQKSLNLFRHNGLIIPYDKYGCNSEHWILAWRYGVAMSLQSNPWMFWQSKFKSKHDDCPAPGLKSCQ